MKKNHKKPSIVALATKPSSIPGTKPASYDDKLNKTTRENLVTSIAMSLQRFPNSLFAKDLSTWATARMQALQVYQPKRYLLQEVYVDAMLDLVLSGIIEKRILKITKRNIKICDTKGEPNEEATKLLRKSWVRKFLRLALESRFYGHSLIEFVFDDKRQIKDVQLIDRRFVAPEFNLFLINPMDFEGYDYTMPPFNQMCIGVGEKADLGLLLKLSLYQFIKKNAIGNWSEFAEIFGMPLRYANTPTLDSSIRRDVEDMLQNMGSATWGVFPLGTEIKFQETTKTDSFKVYDELINRINKEMAIAVLGQTMTTEDGSSRSQAEVHERSEDDITSDDALFILNIIQDKLLPFLNLNGYKISEDLEAHWDEVKEVNLIERSAIDLAITQMGFKPTKQYMEETYGITLDEIQEAQPDNPNKDKKTSKNSPSGSGASNAQALLNIHARLKNLYT